MSDTTRHRLARLVRQPRPDLAEAALLCCAEVEPELDVDGELLRLDAFADQLRTQGLAGSAPREAAAALAAHLGGELGFTGDRDTYHDPRNGLFTRVLDRRQGLPISLSILWISVAQRLEVEAFGIGLPGHFVAGIGPVHSAVVVDPFHNGVILDEDDLAERVRSATHGQASFRPEMIRPAAPAAVVRRLLNNLTRDFLGQGDVEDALWTVELKQLLPGTTPEDTRVRGELLLRVGRYDEAAAALEDYVELADGSEDHADIQRLAIRARAKLN